MTATQNSKARHRAACRPTTVFTPLVQQAQRSSRATVAMAASGGLALTLIAVPALASQADGQPVDVSNLTRDARRALAVNPTVTVPASASFSLDAHAVTAAAPVVEEVAPVVEETPAPVEEEQAASRDEVREEIVEQSAPEAAPAAEESISVPETGGVGTPGAVHIAERHLGSPYVWGASSPDVGFDCSGLTTYVYSQLGIYLPRTSYEQRIGTWVSASEALPGDLVNWGGHVGIYAGNGMVIHAPTEGGVVEYASIWGAPDYYRLG